MKKYKYLLFDWDGCLAMTLDVWLQAYKEVFSEYNVYPEDREIALKVFGDWNAPLKFGINDVDTFTKKMITKVNERYSTLQLYNGVKDTLQTIKAKDKRLALLTTSTSTLVLPSLEYHKLKEYFDTILTAESVTKHKPDPEIIEKAINELGGSKELSIIIGDSKSDLGAAQNAGIDSALFYPEHNQVFYDLERLKSFNPTYTITKFDKLLEIL
ncbi:MAG: HAD family hydrolase [Candidatus Levyibacteriota bacterium]